MILEVQMFFSFHLMIESFFSSSPRHAFEIIYLFIFSEEITSRWFCFAFILSLLSSFEWFCQNMMHVVGPNLDSLSF